MTARPFQAAALAAMLLLQPAGAHGQNAVGQTAGATAQETARFDAWIVYRSGTGGNLTCFAISRPGAGPPGSSPREGAYFFLSAWPRQGVRAEPSVRSAVGYRRGSTVTVSIEGSNFILSSEGTIAYIADPTRELKLLDAMRNGSQMIVSGVLGNGLQFRDVYSLSGVTAALAAVAQGCS